MQSLSGFPDLCSQHKSDFGVVDITIRITLEPDAEFKKQLITKVPIHYQDQLQQILDDSETNGIFNRVGLNAAKNNELGSEFINPIKIILKGDVYKMVIDARLLNAKTDVSTNHVALLPVQVLILRINGKIFSTTDLSTAYHQVFSLLKHKN